MSGDKIYLPYTLMAADFETYVSENPETQDETWVWASAFAEINGENVYLHHSIDESWLWLTKQNKNFRLYYHNLKFDGQFWLDFLLTKTNYTQALEADAWLTTKDMPNGSFKYLVSAMGQWYTMTIKTEKGYIIELVDSLKLIPFKLADAGKAFACKHQKLNMEYTGYRDKNTVFTKEEEEYIINDVLCLKECIEVMLEKGYEKSTIGANCRESYNKEFFPVDLMVLPDTEPWLLDLTEVKLSEYGNILPEWTGCDNADEYVRKAYKGGWCYLKKGKENTIYHDGQTLDVNSLYPSVMHSESGSYYPIGRPKFWCGNYIPEKVHDVTYRPFIDKEGRKSYKGEKRYYFFIRIRTRFYLKEGKLPFIQIKNNAYYSGTEHLETSDIFYKGEYYRYLDVDGKLEPTSVELTLTETDYYMFLEHYDVEDFEILDGCYFDAIKGIFDDYINHYAEIKKNNKGVMRNLAKLFLNNLYGQFAKSSDSSFKVAELLDDKIKYRTVEQYEKKVWYIPIGAAITSYARNFTITAAQANYDHFVYADTDSIHLDTQEEAKGVNIHDVDFCCWKQESKWETGWFTRQKTYIEIVAGEWDIKCAGMTQACKDYFVEKYNRGMMNIWDFKPGLSIPSGKLRPKRIKGGIVLVDSPYVMR